MWNKVKVSFKTKFLSKLAIFDTKILVKKFCDEKSNI